MSEIKLKVVVPNIGHGNPFTAYAIARQTGANAHILDGLGMRLLRKLHQLMTKSDRISSAYTERSEDLRAGFGALAIGLIQLGAWFKEETLSKLKGKPISKKVIFVQEHLLGILPEKLLQRETYLYVPDVFPKESAVEILKDKKAVTPIVWNRQAFEELQKKDLNPILSQPVLPFGLIDCEQLPPITRGKRVLKSSGSGMKKEDLERIVGSRQQGEILEVWLPNMMKIVYDDNDPEGREERIEGDLEKYAKTFYQSILDAGEIISYPSEMIQVIASLVSKGWQGRFRVLPPRGQHERRNLKWLEEFVKPKEEDGFFVFDFSTTENNAGITKLTESLGKENLL